MLTRPVVVVTNLIAAILLVNTAICAFGGFLGWGGLHLTRGNVRAVRTRIQRLGWLRRPPRLKSIQPDLTPTKPPSRTVPMHPVVIEVPTNLGFVTRRIRTVGTREAVAIAVLAQGALTINSLYTWYIYQLVGLFGVCVGVVTDGGDGW